ncbi:protein-L-isoaspartate(D-aspartate) O-methyltransferase [Methylophaga sp.]|uniref:protein-L-isoaspartate(D-aspartate) O-methyltransferase n=1 Tax=Methylophaga sp. TaxID=2024840 RepID=UPI0025FD4B1C|nr:protein-L-isoaspartate(D-aspartate) O-methyltransferase [Methylophaga sp.]
MDVDIKYMLENIDQEARLTADYTGRPRFADSVMKAMAQVNRADFVPDIAQSRAFLNAPLAIGHGQTISQPYIVALMTDLLELSPDDRVLELGTGSGYQAAILAKLAKQVYTLERIGSLADAAAGRLQALGFDNVSCRHSNGYHGWPEKAPFDAIMVTAASPFVPPALLDQLKPGGRLVLPLAETGLYQQLTLITKDEQGQTETRPVLAVSFVPLVDD